MNTKAEFRVVVKLTCGRLDRGEQMNIHKWADRETDRQTDRQTNKQTDKQTETELPCKLSTWKKGNEDEQIMLSVAH